MKTTEIINGLETIANQFTFISISWHVIFYVLIIALLSKWQPTNRLFGIILIVPLVSVAVLAWVNGNPFNGLTFSLMAILLLFFANKAHNQVNLSNTIYVIIGCLMIIYGLLYPHFLETDTFLTYLYASPVGLVPCPTLSLLIGFVLVFNGFGSNGISLIFVIFGLFYGLFGAFKLGVLLDLGLIFGSLTLLFKYFFSLKGI